MGKGVPGYVTPKVAVGAAVGNDKGEILLVQRADSGVWLYPTGWADVGYSAAEVVVKEVEEETGIEVEVVRLIAVLDGLRIGMSRIPLYSLVFQCRPIGASSRPTRWSAPTSGGSPSTRCPFPWPGPSAGATTCSRRCAGIPSRCSTTRCAHRSGGATPTRPESRDRGISRTSGADHREPATGLATLAPCDSRPRPPSPEPDEGTPGSPVTVAEVAEVTDELVEAFARLIPQLSSSSPPPGRAELADIVASTSSVLFVARDAGRRSSGSLTLALFRMPTGLRAWIEDVVVDESARGAGAGEALVSAAVERAGAVGARRST